MTSNMTNLAIRRCCIAEILETNPNDCQRSHEDSRSHCNRKTGAKVRVMGVVVYVHPVNTAGFTYILLDDGTGMYANVHSNAKNDVCPGPSFWSPALVDHSNSSVQDECKDNSFDDTNDRTIDVSSARYFNSNGLLLIEMESSKFVDLNLREQSSHCRGILVGDLMDFVGVVHVIQDTIYSRSIGSFEEEEDSSSISRSELGLTSSSVSLPISLGVMLKVDTCTFYSHPCQINACTNTKGDDKDDSCCHIESLRALEVIENKEVLQLRTDGSNLMDSFMNDDDNIINPKRIYSILQTASMEGGFNETELSIVLGIQEGGKTGDVSGCYTSFLGKQSSKQQANDESLRNERLIKLRRILQDMTAKGDTYINLKNGKYLTHSREL